ncbi:hypothetical protein CC80DRAFT_325556 [Byssothecium circinans]|uniref:Uncharacterized protein n=1 Tax=Byssothecium circinans TaxID=147558 RepID=A0A6A5U5T3_9PLEO|nr:hypothetical protein CC80DRAFT_325556 [Byssothecium circinans]
MSKCYSSTAFPQILNDAANQRASVTPNCITTINYSNHTSVFQQMLLRPLDGSLCHTTVTLRQLMSDSNSTSALRCPQAQRSQPGLARSSPVRRILTWMAIRLWNEVVPVRQGHVNDVRTFPHRSWTECFLHCQLQLGLFHIFPGTCIADCHIL